MADNAASDPDERAAGQPDAAGREADIAARLKTLSSIIAPTSLITALLFYFGYLATRARFAYFGVYLDLVNLSTPDLLLYGSEVVYVPVALVGVTVLIAAGLRMAGHWLASDPSRETLAGWVAIAVLLGGVLLLIRAVVGILVPSISRTEFPALTPLSLTLGALLIGYGATLGRRLAARRPGQSWARRPEAAATGRYAIVALVVAGLLWTANSFAAPYGRGRALDDAYALPKKRPAVVLDTREPLPDPPPGVTRTDLPGGKGEFRYRYQGLRLLVESDHRLFLVPAVWSQTSKTMVVDYNANVQIQLIPAPEAPD